MRLAAGLLLAALATPAGADQVYSCTVEDFTTFSKRDPAFVARNREKTYTLTIGPDRITLDMKSAHFAGGRTVFRINQRRESSLSAVDDNVVRLGVVTVPARPGNHLDRNGFFNAVQTVTGSFYSNSWLLRCR